LAGLMSRKSCSGGPDTLSDILIFWKRASAWFGDWLEMYGCH
jgi:hypothetical protein